MRCVLVSILVVCLVLFAALPALADGAPAKTVEARRSVYRIFCEDDESSYSGSSFVLSSGSGGTYLATSYHVIEGCDEDSIVVACHDGTMNDLTIVAFNKERDLAVLHAADPIADAAALRLAAPEEIAVGASVYALGFPTAADYITDDLACHYEDVTMTNGIISAVKHAVTEGLNTTYLQMNAAINPGSSGGPLLNGTGAVLGVNTFSIADSNSVYAAVGVEHLVELLERGGIPFVADTAIQVRGGSESILYLIALCVVGIAVLVIISVKILKKNRRLSLGVLMRRRLQGYSLSEAAAMLRPVCGQLLYWHQRGEMRGAITPDNLFLCSDGTLQLGRARQKKGVAAQSQNKAYQAIECYEQSSLGSFTDVYALGGILYYLLTARELPSALVRIQGDANAPFLDSPQEEREILAAATAMERGERLHDAKAFMGALGLTATAMGTKAVKCHGGSAKPTALRIVCIAVTIVIGIAVAVIWIRNEDKYQAAVSYLENGAYTEAREQLVGTLLFYKDTARLENYIEAGKFLEIESFNEAKAAFLEMEDYRDAATMVLECDYQKGKALLREAHYDEALAVFMALSHIPYKDAMTMMDEVPYQRAKALIETFEETNGFGVLTSCISQALPLLNELGDYKNAGVLRNDLRAQIYHKAKTLFDQSAEWYNTLGKTGETQTAFDNMDRAKTLFDFIPDYSTSVKYIKTIEIVRKNMLDRAGAFKELRLLWDFLPARSLILGDTYICFFLEGSWKGDGYRFKMDKDGEIEYDIPYLKFGKYYRIHDLILSVGSDEKGWRSMYAFTARNLNTIDVYAYKNGRTYTLNRQ